MSKANREIELKFELSEAALQRLRKKPILREIGTAQPVTRRLRSIYFDTPDCRLRQVGLSARVRRDQGKWLQTIKEIRLSPETSPGRIEAETEISEPVPDLSLVNPPGLNKRIRAALDDQKPRPMFETDVLRTTRILRTEDGGEIELAIDKGNILGCECSEPIAETEFELKHGHPASLFPIARSILAGEAFRVTRASKAEKGYRLINCCSMGSVSPAMQEAISLNADDTVWDAFGAIVCSCGRQILKNIDAVLESDDPEGAHQLRIGLRRLRCALRAHRKLLPKAFRQSVNDPARDFARIVGSLRDIDVLIDEFATPYAARYDSNTSAHDLLDELCAHRDRIRKVVRSELSSPSFSAFQLDLLNLLNDRSIGSSFGQVAPKLADSSLPDFAARVLERSWTRVMEYGMQIDRISVADRHEMRKALKNYRYTVEFYKSLYPPKSLRRYMKHLKRLQDVFGFLNDVAMANKLRKICGADRKADQNVMWTIGHIQGLNETRAEIAWEDAKERWQKLSEARPIWATG